MKTSFFKTLHKC